MERDHLSNSDVSETTNCDEVSPGTRSRSATPSSTIEPWDIASGDESCRLSDSERIISSEEDDSAALANREVEFTSGQSQATSTASALMSTAPSSNSCSGPPSPSLLQDSDIELAESVRDALGLSCGNSFTTLTEYGAAEVGDRMRKVLAHAADGALVPLLHKVLSTNEVKKLAALKGIHAEESQPLFRNVKIKDEERTDSQSTDDIDERMGAALADMEEIQMFQRDQAIKEEPLSLSSDAQCSKAASLDIDNVLNFSSDEESEGSPSQRIKQPNHTDFADSEDEGFGALIIQEIKEGVHDALIDGILSGKKRSKRHNYFVRVINDERTDLNLLFNQISSKLVSLSSPSFLVGENVEEFNRATREKLIKKIEILTVPDEFKVNSTVIDYYLTFCLQPELLIYNVQKIFRSEKMRKTYRDAELLYLESTGDFDLVRFHGLGRG